MDELTQQNAEDALTNALSGPARVSGDAGSVEQHSIPDLIQADKYLSGKAAAANPNRGLMITSLIPDGTVHVRPFRRRRFMYWYD